MNHSVNFDFFLIRQEVLPLYIKLGKRKNKYDERFLPAELHILSNRDEFIRH